MRMTPAEAMTYLKDGAVFVLRPELKLPRSRKHTLRMRLRLKDGNFDSRAWNYSKRRLESMAKLLEGRTQEGWRQWSLK
jgi:hypothetical protein